MAPFTKYLQAPNDPSYLGYSKEIDGPKPNLALAKLFSGLGETLDAGIKGGTDLLDIKIEDEIRNKLKASDDGVTDLSLEDAATLGKMKNRAEAGGAGGLGGSASILPEGAQGPVQPAEVTQGISNLDKMYQMYQNGQMSPTYWMIQQQKIAQQLMQRFPGSEKEIQSALHRQTAPANEIRRQVFADFQAAAAAANSANKQWDSWVDHNSKWLGAEGLRMARDPSVYADRGKQTEIMSRVAGMEESVHKEATRHAKINTEIAQGNLDANNAERSLTLDLHGQVGRMASNALNPAMTNLQKQIDQAAATGKFTPEFIQSANAALTDIERTVDATFDEHVNKPRFDGGQSYASSIKDPTRISQIRNQAKQNILNLRDAINNNQTGLAGYFAKNLEMQKDWTAGQIFENSTEAKVLGGMEKALGGQGNLTGKLLIDNKVLTKIWEDTVKLNRSLKGALEGTGDPSKVMNKEDSRPIPASIPLGVIKQINTLITDPTSTPEMRKNAITYLTNDTQGDFFKNLTKEAQLQAFTQLTSTEMSQSIFNTDAQLYSRYTDWAQRVFNSHLMARKGDLTTVLQNKELGLQYDPETNQLTYNPASPLTLRNPAGGGTYQQLVNIPELQTVIQLNNGLRNLDTVYKQQNVKAGDKIGPLFQSMGIPIVQPTTGTGTGKRSEASAPTQLAFAPVDEVHSEAQQAITAALTHAAGVIPGSTPEGMNAVAKLIPEKSLQGKIVSPMEIAQQFEGAHELRDRQIISAFISDAAGKRIDPVTTAWCAAFVNAVLNEGGIKGTGSLMARSFLNFGQSVNTPQKGDIVVLSRGRDQAKGHVGFFDSMTEDGKVRVLAGNQNNRVSYGEFPSSQVLGIRRASPKDAKNAS